MSKEKEGYALDTQADESVSFDTITVLVAEGECANSKHISFLLIPG